MSGFIAAKGFDEGSTAGATILIADVSLGNVGQLAADLIVTTLQLERVGFFDDDAVLAVVGAEEGGKLCTSIEIYGGKEGVFVLQQRAAVVPSQAEAFAARMSGWLASAKFSTVLVLTSLSASLRTDRQLAGENYQMTAACALRDGASSKRVAELNWEVLNEDDIQEGHAHAHAQVEGPPPAEAVMHEATAVARGLFNECGDANVDCTLLLAYCEEGDNVADGVQMAECVRAYMGEKLGAVAGWKAPPSWRVMMQENAARALYA